MRTFLRNIVATVVLLMSLIVNTAKGQTGSVYPVDLNVMLAPPFGTCLTDLTNTNRFVIQALLRDMNHGNDYQMVIQMRVKSLSSLNTVFLSHTKPFSIGMGKPTVVLSANNSTVSISDFFDEANILALPGSVRLNNNCLPEGSYMFCFQAFDAMAYFGGQRIPISKEFALTAFMEDGAAPILLSPKNNDSIPCMATDINFQWQQPFVTSGLNTYTLQIAEVTSPSFDSPQVLEIGDYLIERPGLMVPMCNIPRTESNFKENHTYYWRVIMCDKNGTPRYNYPNKGASPAYRFVYCGTPQEPEPEDPWEQKVPQAKAIGKGLDTLRMDSVRVDEATTCTAIWFKDSVEVREKYDGVIIEVKKKTQDTWTPFKLESTVRTDTTIELSSLSYNDSFMVRGQYYMLEEGKPVYAPYSDTVYFRIKHPADTVDCGAPVPELTDCSGSGERSEFRLGDRFSANGTSVTIDSIISQKVNGSSLTLTGLGHIPFPILSNFGLKVSFTDVEINCDNQLKRGKVISVYDEKTAAMIDLNNIIGKGSAGNDLGQSDAILNDGGGDVSNLSEGDVILNDDNKVTVKDPDGNEISVGTIIDLSSSSVYSDNTSLNDSKVYIKFSNPDYENIAFDDDDQNLRKSSFTLAENYRDFGGGYIIPWVASNPGRKFQLKATPSDNFKSEGYTDVKFVIPASSGKHIELESEADGEGYLVSISGISTNKQSTVYAIARKSADSPYENVGKLNLCCYTYKTKKIVIVPLVEGITVSADEVKTALEKIYGKLGYTFEVEVDNAHSNGVRKSITLESTVMSEFSSDMKEVINGYKANIDADDSYSYDKEAAYLFLMDKPEGSFAETKGIMPQKQQFGFIFMQGSKSVATAETHTMAHELGHGLFGLDHVFIKSYGIGEGTTHNLMDYTKNTPDDFLSYHEWSQINSPVMSWSLFNSDEGNMLFGDDLRGICITPKGTPFIYQTDNFNYPKELSIQGPVYSFKAKNKDGQVETFRYDYEKDAYIGRTSNTELNIERQTSLNDNETIWLVNYVDKCNIEVYTSNWGYVKNNYQNIVFSNNSNLKYKDRYASVGCSESNAKINENFINPDNIYADYLDYYKKHAKKTDVELADNETYVKLFVNLVKDQIANGKSSDKFGEVLADILNTYEHNKYNKDGRKFIVVSSMINYLSISQTSWDAFAAKVFEKAGLTDNDVLICLPYANCSGIGYDLGQFFFMPGLKKGNNIKIDFPSLRKDYSNIQNAASVLASVSGGLETYADLKVFQYVYDVFRYTHKVHVKRPATLNINGDFWIQEIYSFESGYPGTFDFRFEVDDRVTSHLNAYKEYEQEQKDAVHTMPMSGGYVNTNQMTKATEKYNESCMNIRNTAPSYHSVTHGMNEQFGTSNHKNCEAYVRWYRYHFYHRIYTNSDNKVKDEIKNENHDSPSDDCFYGGKNEAVYNENLEWIDALGVILTPFSLDWAADIIGCMYAGAYGDYVNASIYGLSATVPYVNSKPLKTMVKYEGKFEDAMNGLRKGTHTIAEVTEESSQKKVLKIVELTGDNTSVGSKYAKYIEDGLTPEDALKKISKEFYGDEHHIKNIFTNYKNNFDDAVAELKNKMGKDNAIEFLTAALVNVALYYFVFELTKEKEDDEFMDHFPDCLSDAVTEAFEQVLGSSSKKKYWTACKSALDIQNLSKLKMEIASVAGVPTDEKYKDLNQESFIGESLDLVGDCLLGVFVEFVGTNLKSLLNKHKDNVIMKNLKKLKGKYRADMLKNLDNLAKLPNGTFRHKEWKDKLGEVIKENVGLDNINALLTKGYRISTLTKESLEYFNEIMSKLAKDPESQSKFLKLFDHDYNMNQILWFMTNSKKVQMKNLVDILEDVYSNINKYAGKVNLVRGGKIISLEDFIKNKNLPEDMLAKFYKYEGSFIKVVDDYVKRYDDVLKRYDNVFSIAQGFLVSGKNFGLMYVTNIDNKVFIEFAEDIDKKITEQEQESLKEFLPKVEACTDSDIEKIINEYEGKFTHLYIVPVSKAEQYVEEDNK